MKKFVSLVLAVTLIFSALTLTSCSSKKREITVGSSNFTEVVILGNIYKILIEENTDIKVNTSFGLNGATFCFAAMQNKDIDMFVEYSGSMLSNVCKQPMNNDPDQVYETIKRVLDEEHNVYTSAPLGFNNTYIMSVKPETAEKYNLKTLTDLVKVASELKLGCTMEFVQRADCLPLFEKTFNTKFKDVSGLDASVRYTAIDSNQVDVIDAFTTDALLSKMKLTTLEDDAKFFPPYYACNFIRKDTLEKYPELEELLSKLDGLFDEETMAALNVKVDIDGQNEVTVAREFLEEKGLI